MHCRPVVAFAFNFFYDNCKLHLNTHYIVQLHSSCARCRGLIKTEQMHLNSRRKISLLFYFGVVLRAHDIDYVRVVMSLNQIFRIMCMCEGLKLLNCKSYSFIASRMNHKKAVIKIFNSFMNWVSVQIALDLKIQLKNRFSLSFYIFVARQQFLGGRNIFHFYFFFQNKE
jgi:hypothetical protein